MACNPMIFGMSWGSFLLVLVPKFANRDWSCNDNGGKGNMSNDLMSRGYIMNSFGALSFRIIWLLLLYICSLWKAILYEDKVNNQKQDILKQKERQVILSVQSTS